MAWLIAFFALSLASPQLLSVAQEAAPADYRDKATLIHKIAKFVRWPVNAFPQSASPLCIGVLGQDPFGQDLEDSLKNKTLHGRSIVFKRFQNASEVQDCQILFISQSETEKLDEILTTLGDSSILTVSESNGFIGQGGIINLVGSGKFEINSVAMRRANLRIGSDLYGVALRVVKAKRLQPN